MPKITIQDTEGNTWATLEVPPNSDTVAVMDRDFDGVPFCKEAKSTRDEQMTQVLSTFSKRLKCLQSDMAFMTLQLTVTQTALQACLDLLGVDE